MELHDFYDITAAVNICIDINFNGIGFQIIGYLHASFMYFRDSSHSLLQIASQEKYTRPHYLLSSIKVAYDLFKSTSTLNSRAEQGYDISKFESTVGCKTPRVPILMSLGEAGVTGPCRRK